MAWLWSRKRSASSEPAPADEPVESVRLDSDEHAWWVQEEVKEVWRPKAGREAEAEPERDILAEHFGDDWRTNFGFTPTADEPESGEPEASSRPPTSSTPTRSSTSSPPPPGTRSSPPIANRPA